MPWNSSDLETLSVTMAWPFQMSAIWEDNITTFPSQMEQRISYQTATRYAFSGTTTYLDSTELATLLSLWNTVQGRMTPFKWVYDGTTRYVRFNQKSLIMNNVFYGRWTVEISLIDVHASEINIDD